MPLVLLRSSIRHESGLSHDLAVMAADEFAVDLQIVVGGSADHQASRPEFALQMVLPPLASKIRPSCCPVAARHGAPCSTRGTSSVRDGLR